MKGVAKTVFKGTTIDTFPVTVIGIIKKAVADTDVILIKVDSPYLKEKGIGLVRGMSGSPVYFNGKLAGAIAYGWGFTKEAVAGVVPIHAMLEELASPEGGKTENYRNYKLQNTGYLEPLGTICQVSGLTGDGLTKFKKAFPQLDFVPFGNIAGTSGRSKLVSKSFIQSHLKEGAAIGVDLVRGDFSVTAIGTLSYQEGNKILAFGHPMMFLGKVDLPMSLVSIAYILPSIEFPAKIGSVIGEIGRIKEDRLYALGGILGEKAKMVPMAVTVYDNERNIRKKFHVEIAQEPRLLALASSIVAQRALEAASSRMGEGSALVSYSLYFKELPPLKRENLVYSETSPGQIALFDMEKSIMDLLENDFQKVHLEKIELSIKMRPDIPLATLRRVFVEKRRLEPGEPVKLTVEIQPFNGKVERRALTIPLPPDMNGQLMLGVSGGLEYEKIRKTIGIPTPTPVSLEQLYKLVERRPPFNALQIQIALPRRGAVLGGEKVQSLPSFLLDIIEEIGISGVTLQPDELTKSIELPWILAGSQVIDLFVGKMERELQVFPPKKQEPSLPPHPAPSLPEGKDEPPAQSPGQPPMPLLLQKTGAGIEFTGKKFGFEQAASIPHWDRGKFNGVAVTDSGSLILTPRLQEVTTLREPFIWSLAENNKTSTVYVGTGLPGNIYKISHNSFSNVPPKLLYNTKEEIVTALIVASNGDLFAGTSRGTIFHFDEDGILKNKIKTGEEHIWSLLFDLKDTIYIGTGGIQGKIFRWDYLNNKTLKHIATLSQSHVLSLALGKDGSLYAGTSNAGIIVKVSKINVSSEGLKVNVSLEDYVTPLFSTQAFSVTAMAFDKEGTLYFGTSPDGKIYKFNLQDSTLPDKIQPYYDLPDTHIASIVPIANGELLVSTGKMGSLYKISPPGKAIRIIKGEQEELISLRGGHGGTYWGASGSQGKIFQINNYFSYNSKGEFFSQIFDTGDLSRWGIISWTSQNPKGTDIKVETRSGNSPISDETWSLWQEVSLNSPIKNPMGRYFQYRATLSSKDPGQTPLLEELHFYYKRINHPPYLSLTAPAGVGFFSKRVLIKARVNDPDGDTTFISFWRKKESAETAKEANGKTDGKTGWEKIGERFINKVERLSFSGNGDEEIIQEWDTKEVSDGHYRLRVLISDFPNNTHDEEYSKEVSSKPIVIDNTPPVMNLSLKEIHEDEPILIEGLIKDNLSPVKEVLFRLPLSKKSSASKHKKDSTSEMQKSDSITKTEQFKKIEQLTIGKLSEWNPAISGDGIFDSQEESFILRFIPLSAGSYPLEIKGVDMAGNETIKTFTLNVTR